MPPLNETNETTHNFRVGDIIVGNEHNEYRITKIGQLCKVVGININYFNCPYIKVILYPEELMRDHQTHEEGFEVDPACFDLVHRHIEVPQGQISQPEINIRIEEDLGSCIDCDYSFDDEDERYSNDYDDNYRCSGCDSSYVERQQNNEDDYGTIPHRDYESDKLISKRKNNLETDILQSSRGFGVEIEAYGKTYADINHISEDIDNRIGITGDGSLSSKGFELQFPLINGKQGEKMVKDTCKILSEYTTTVNKDCGYHIHLQCQPSEQYFAFVQRLMFASLVFDDVVMSFLPSYRRTNRYCQTVKRFISMDKVLQAKTKEDLDFIWYKTFNKRDISRRKEGKYDESRYCGFNFHCYLSKLKHLEIRHHTGTINAKKILQWANLHTLLLDAIHREVDKEQNIDKWDLKESLFSVYDRSFNDNFMHEKTELFFDFIGLSQKSRDYFLARQKQFNS